MSSFRLRHSEPLENQVQRAVLHALSVHPKVGSVWRVNTAAGKLVRASGASQWIKFGFTGCPDIHGYLKTGKALYVECKRPSGKETREQREFLESARAAGCVAFTARSASDVFDQLETA